MLLNSVEQSQLISDNYCSGVSYSSLKFDYGDWCVLYLRVADDYNERFYVRKLSCPAGFVEINKICECDPMTCAHTHVQTHTLYDFSNKLCLV